MKLNTLSLATLFCGATAFFSTISLAGDNADSKSAITVDTQEKTPLDLLSLDSNYTGRSNVRHALVVGKQDMFSTDFEYSHRIHVNGNWYLRLGIEYQRFDFTGSPSPLPDHLQGVSTEIAYEYVVKGFAAAGISIHPGVYFENDISSKSFDIPISLFTSFKIRGDKLFGIVGVYERQMLKPAVDPLGGIIWLINDKVRLEALVPQSALVYTPNDKWEFRAEANINGGGFRVDNDASVPAAHRGSMLQYTYYEAGALATYNGWKPFSVSVGGGYDFRREFDYFRDGPGTQVYRASGAPYVRVSLGARF